MSRVLVSKYTPHAVATQQNISIVWVFPHVFFIFLRLIFTLGKAGFRSLLIRPNTVGLIELEGCRRATILWTVPTVYWRNAKMCLSPRGNYKSTKIQKPFNPKIQKSIIIIKS